MPPFFVSELMSGLLAQTRFNMEILHHAGALQTQLFVGMMNLPSELFFLACSTRAQRAITHVTSSPYGRHQVVFAAFGERRP